MKRLIATVLAILCLLSVSGCKSSNSVDSLSNASTSPSDIAEDSSNVSENGNSTESDSSQTSSKNSGNNTNNENNNDSTSSSLKVPDNSSDYVSVKTTGYKNFAAGPTAAKDDYNRTLPFSDTTGTLEKNNREVGLFYFLWMSDKAGPYTFKDVFSKNPDFGKAPVGSPWISNAMYFLGKTAFRLL